MLYARLRPPGTRKRPVQIPLLSGDGLLIPTRIEAAWIAGFVAAEGTFTRADTPPTFTFAVGLGASDSESCIRLHEFFGVGSINFSPRRKPHFDNEVRFSVRAFPDLMNVIVPFMDEHLPPSYKRTQYLQWREVLLDYWKHRAKRRRPCIVPGCETRRRAHGYCRKHLYQILHR